MNDILGKDLPVAQLHLVYEEEERLFVFRFTNKEELLFETKMPFMQFETLAIDMMSIVKSFNLAQAKAYTKKLEEENAQKGIEMDK